MLAQCRKRWANNSPALGECLVFAGRVCDETFLFYNTHFLVNLLFQYDSVV